MLAMSTCHDISARPLAGHARIVVRAEGILLDLFLTATQARNLAAQLQAAANTATAALVIHQKEAVQP